MELSISLIVVMAFGLSMDAFAVSVTNGMCYRMPTLKNALSSGLAFGIAQAMMPLIGYFAGHSFSGFVTSIDHWLALFLLSFIGGKMLLEAHRKSKNPAVEGAVVKVFSQKTLWVQAIATSIDALAVGISMGVIQVNIWLAVAIIGVTTFLCCFCGVIIGRRFGALLRNKAEVLGGILLILIGLNIFWEHMGYTAKLHFR